MSNIAAIHLIMANAQIGAPVLSGSVLIFGNKKARADFVVSNWCEQLAAQGDMFKDSNQSHIELLINSGAEVIEESLIASRITGCQALHQTNGTIWQNHYESHVSHYAYLWALSGQKRDVMLKGANLDGYTLNAANRFVAECERSIPTGASSPEVGLFYLKELYISAKRLLGHDIDSDGAKVIKAAAPSLAAAVSLPTLPVPAHGLPPLPQVSTKSLTLPPLPATLPPLPKP